LIQLVTRHISLVFSATAILLPYIGFEGQATMIPQGTKQPVDRVYSHLSTLNVRCGRLHPACCVVSMELQSAVAQIWRAVSNYLVCSVRSVPCSSRFTRSNSGSCFTRSNSGGDWSEKSIEIRSAMQSSLKAKQGGVGKRRRADLRIVIPDSFTDETIMAYNSAQSLPSSLLPPALSAAVMSQLELDVMQCMVLIK
jgi:hypothetical protein